MGIKIYKNSVVYTVFYDKTDAEETGCTVKFDGDSIRVEYRWDEVVYVYEGKDIGNGHYELSMKENRATLHRTTPESKILEGSWKEDGYYGMWRILLKE